MGKLATGLKLSRQRSSRTSRFGRCVAARSEPRRPCWRWCRGGAGPVRGLLGGKDLTGLFACNPLSHRGAETQRSRLNLVVSLCALVSLWLILLLFQLQQLRGFS